MKRKLIAAATFLAASLSQPPVVLAQLGGSCGTEEVDTAIGCIPISGPSSFIVFLLRWGLGIGGGIAFILLVIAGFQILTSQGDPHRLQAGRELLTSAITGILMLIFSIFLLRFIGVNILQIPGLAQ